MTLDLKDVFLIEACRKGHGDIQKAHNVTEICKNTHLSLADEQIDNQIIYPLLIGGYIKGSIKEGIIITRKGYYYAIKISGESAQNFGMVSYKEAKRLSFDTLKYICKRHDGKTESKNNIFEIKPGGYEGALNAYGEEVIKQVAEILDLSDSWMIMAKLKLPLKELKRYLGEYYCKSIGNIPTDTNTTIPNSTPKRRS